MKIVIALVCSLLITGSAKGQTACDSITTEVKYAGFADSLIEITAYNHGHTFYSYPGFIVYNSSADTVAKEEVDLFGLGYPSSHKLKIRNLPGNTFTGTLQLWTYFYDSLTCTYQTNFNLCPDTCEKVHPYFGNYGGAFFFGTVNWDVKNSGQQTIASGTFTLDSAQQFVEDSTCLMPGSYTLAITPVGTIMPAGQPVAGIRANGQSAAPQPYAFFVGSALQLPFDFYRKCLSTTGTAVLPTARAMSIFTSGGMLHVRNNGNEIGVVMVYNMEGRLVYSVSTKEAAIDVDVSGLPTSIYVVRVVNSKGQYSEKVVVGL